MSLLGLQRVGSGPVLVWLHGFTQTRDSSHLFLSILAGTNEVVTIDLPGHGLNAATSASLPETANLLAEVLPDTPLVLGGYSFGARVALHVALAHPERLAGLIVLSATAGILDDTERAQRRSRDEQLAEHVEAVGAKTFLEEWLSQPMFDALPHDPRERAARSTDASGLANSLRHSGTGTQHWLLDDLRSLRMPTLILAGERDEKFTLEAQRLADAIPHSTLALIADAGHAAHLERPDVVAEVLRAHYPQ
jgi:2-succinyl-6-hydroxy-2,4-cyclohexadiene-1-carboxylate synthase